MKIDLMLFFMIFYVVIITHSVSSFAEDTFDNSDGFMIIFWDSGEIDEVKDLTYPQLIEKLKPLEILTEDYILKYYWDEQLLEFDLEKYRKGTDRGMIGVFCNFFTIVLNKRIIYHGLSRMVILDMIDYESDYPAITEFPKKTEKTTILALTPKFWSSHTFTDFSEKEQKKILDQEVLEYFEKKGKIIRGEKDLNEILGFKFRNIIKIK